MASRNDYPSVFASQPVFNYPKKALGKNLAAMKQPWNVEVRIAVPTRPNKSEAIELKKIKTAFNEDPYPQRHLEHELKPTGFETATIKSANAALGHLLARLHLPQIEVPSERIHVLTREEFFEKMVAVGEQKDGTTEAKMIHGHIYIPRNENPIEFCRFLTHELCHAAS